MSRPRELLLDYANGNLPPHEKVRLEEHLQACPACRAEVREAREGLVGLVESLPRERMPASAWQGITRRVRRTRTRVTRALAWSLSVALLVVAAGGLWSLQELNRRATAEVDTQVVARWLANEQVERISLGIYPSGGYGSVLLHPDGRALYVLSEPPETGHSYQAWGHGVNGPVSLGVFEERVFEVSSVRGFDALGVSLEPAGGSPVPTHPLGRADLPSGWRQ